MGFPSPHPPKKNFESGSEVTLMMSPNHHRTIGVTCHRTVDWQVGGPKHCWWLGRWFSTHPPTEKQFQKWFQGDIDDITSEPPKNHRCHLPKPFWWVGGWLFHPLTHRKKNFESGSEVTPEPPKNHCDSKILIYQVIN